jgi:hypothetical protein
MISLFTFLALSPATFRISHFTSFNPRPRPSLIITHHLFSTANFDKVPSPPVTTSNPPSFIETEIHLSLDHYQSRIILDNE